MSEMHLKELFAKVRDGDKDAFVLIYNDLKHPVFTIAYRIVQSRESAEDITHDIFVKLFVSPPDSSVRNPRAWIFRMTHNLAIDTLRQKQHSNVEGANSTLATDFGDVTLRLDLERAIQKLDVQEREVLSLHLTGGLRFHEIANILNCSMPSTYRTYRKALRNLQVLLEGGVL